MRFPALILLAAALLVGSARGASESPGGLRVREDGEATLYREYINGEQVIVTMTSEDPILVERVERGYRLTLSYTEQNHVFVDVAANRIPRALDPTP